MDERVYVSVDGEMAVVYIYTHTNHLGHESDPVRQRREWMKEWKGVLRWMWRPRTNTHIIMHQQPHN